MALNIKQVGLCFAGEVSGLDLTKPLSREEVLAIHAGMDQFAVLIFRGPKLSNDQHMAFTKRLGGVEQAIGTSLREPKDHRLSTDFADVSNLDKDERPFEREDRRRLFAIGNRLRHSDSSFKPTPAKYSILHAHAIPTKGGNTEFADMRAAYDDLSDAHKAEIEDYICEHSIFNSRAAIGFTDFTKEEYDALPPVPQLLVRTHPGSKRKCLYLASHANSIEGLPLPEAKILLLDLMEHATQRKYVYTHHWRSGDVVMWDNRCLVHARTDFPSGQRRLLRRVTISDEYEVMAA